MATMPRLFDVLATIDAGPRYLHLFLHYVRDTAGRWSVTLTGWSGGTSGRWALQIGIAAIPALWLASLVRAIRVRSWKPSVVTAVASVLGVLGIPIATWIGKVVLFLWWIAGYVSYFFGLVLPWVVRIVLWAAALALGIAVIMAVGYSVYALVAYLANEKRWRKAAFLLLFVGALVGAAAVGWFDAFFDWLGTIVHFLGVWIERIAGWVAAFLAPAVRFVAHLVVLLTVFLLVLGIVVGTLGQAGRTVYLPFTSAFKAGGDQGRCADLAAGAGVTMSLVLTAAVLDGEFGRQFAEVWSGTPFVSSLPMPVDGFGFLLPGAAEDFLRPAFAGYLSIVDLALLVLVATLGVGSLLFRPPGWSDEHGSRIAIPIMLALGAAIALALVLIVVALWLAAGSDT